MAIQLVSTLFVLLLQVEKYTAKKIGTGEKKKTRSKKILTLRFSIQIKQCTVVKVLW